MRRRWLEALAVGSLSAAVFVLVRPHLIDDAYISLSYARNLAFHGQWALVTGHPANTATSPLYVLVLAALTVVLRDAVLAAGAVFVLSQVFLALALRRLGTRAGLPGWFMPLAMLLLAVNPFLVSSIGMEVTLGAAIISWLAVCLFERRPWTAGVLAGAVVLVRLDLAVFAAVLFFGRRRFWQGAWKTVPVALLVALPWYVFSWQRLGSAVPDTLIIKTLQKAWGEWDFANGPDLYTIDFAWETALSFAPVALAVLFCPLWIFFALRGSVRARAITPFAVLGFAAFAYYLVFSWAGVPPYHWYYAPSLFGGTVFCAAAIAVTRRIFALPGAALGTAIAVASMVVYALPGLPRDQAPITTNHASSAQYREMGERIRVLAAGRPVRSAGEIGALAYFCDCVILDQFSDRGQIPAAIEARKESAGSWGRALLDANYRHFDFALRPEPVALELTRADGTPPPDALDGWATTSPWVGPHHLYLVPVR